MKHILLIICTVISFVSLNSCESAQSLNPTKAVITGRVSNLDKHENKSWLEFLHPDLFTQEVPFEQIEIDSLGYFKYEIEIVSPSLCWGIYNKWFPVVISPGDSLFLSIDANIWDDSSPNPVEAKGYVKISGTVKPDYDKIIRFEKWASDSIYTLANTRLKNQVQQSESADEFRNFMKDFETRTQLKVQKFGGSNNAGDLFYEILNSEIKYKTLKDLMRYWWIKPFESGQKMEDIVLPNGYFTFLSDYEMDNKDFFEVNRLAFIKELQFFLQFQNTVEHETFVDIYQNERGAQVNNDYFNCQAVYISDHTKGITRDLCLHFFALYNLQKIPEKSAEIYASVSNLMQDPYVVKHFKDKFNSTLLENTTRNISVELNQKTALDSVIALNRGKIMYVDFWAPWCGPCMAEMKPSKQLREKLKGENVIFIYLACNCSEKSWLAAIAKNDIEGTNLLLSTNDYSILSRRYALRGIPHYLIIDKSGKTINNAARPSYKNIESELLKLR